MHDLTVLLTFAGGLTFALVFGAIALRLKLSPIVGYLMAGVLAGPFTPGYVADASVAEQFAEIGVILLLFGIGLRFHLKELFAVWRIAVPGALIQSLLSTLLVASLLRWFGWSWQSGIILGIAISVASTVVMALVLGEHHDLHAPIGHIAIGWTVVEDLLTVVVLLLLPLIFGGNSPSDSSLWIVLGVAGIKVIALVATVAVLGTWVIPRLLEGIARSRSRELFTLAVLVIGVGIAVGAAMLFGVSMALGAFLAGLAVGRSEFAARAANDALPMRDAFAVLFFVSVGMLFDPRALVQAPIPILLVLLVVLFGKPLAAALTVRTLGKPDLAIPVGVAFSQIGEFSFILGSVARGLGLIDSVGWNALVASSIISIAINPAWYRLARKWSAKNRQLEPPKSTEPVRIDRDRCIVVGYGPVGRIVHRLLLSQGLKVTVIDLNLDAVRELREQGHAALYGDVLRPGTLEEAGIASVGSLILSADVDDAAEIVRYARAQNPNLDVLVRCSHLRDVGKLQLAGATRVFAGEAEVGVALAEAVHFGEDRARGDISLQRDAVRDQLYGSA